MDFLVFCTAVLGKVSIVGFFNDVPAKEGMEAILNRKCPEYFNFSQRNAKENSLWALNFLLTLNMSFFWAALAKQSFEQSSDLLESFHTSGTTAAANAFNEWYVWIWCVVASFYANLYTWPPVHAGRKTDGL